MTIGRGSFLSELVERAGGENLFADVDLVLRCGEHRGGGGPQPGPDLYHRRGPAAFATRPEWQVVPAVREQRFLRVSGSEFNRPSPRAPGDPRAHRAAGGADAGDGSALVLGLLVVVACLLIGLVGSGSPPAARGLGGLWQAVTPAAAIVRELRAPRVVLAFLVGGSLGICGAALQAMIRNPLAEPYLLGLSSGAGLGAVIAIATRAAGAWAVPLAAFVGALAAVALVYRLSLVPAAGSTPMSCCSPGWSSAPLPARS